MIWVSVSTQCSCTQLHMRPFPTLFINSAAFRISHACTTVDRTKSKAVQACVAKATFKRLLKRKTKHVTWRAAWRPGTENRGLNMAEQCYWFHSLLSLRLICDTCRGGLVAVSSCRYQLIAVFFFFFWYTQNKISKLISTRIRSTLMNNSDSVLRTAKRFF